MKSVLWETRERNQTLWTVLRKHPEIMNQVEYNGQTLLCQAMLDCRESCMFQLVEFGAEFDDVKLAMC